MKHPIEDHSLFGIDLIDELVKEHLQPDIGSDKISNFARDTDVFDCIESITDEANYDKLWEVPNLSDSEDDTVDLDNLVCKYEELECSKRVEVQVVKTKKPLSAQTGAKSNSTNLNRKQSKAEIISAHLMPNLNQVGQLDLKPTYDTSSSPSPPIELKSLPRHLKYAYLGNDQQFLVILTNNLHWEQEEKLLHVLSQHKKAIGWKLFDLPSINPSICMHRILMEEEACPIRQQWRRLNPTILDVLKKEVMKLLVAGIIYPISIQNSWRVCIDYRNLNQENCKDHFPLPFIDQVLEKLAEKSHYCFLDGFSRYMQIHITPEDQHKTTFTCPFGTFMYTHMPFGLCNVSSTFQHCMTSIFSTLL
ncbi:hypothetical protein CR513_39798, partial [Mucuna pruriens]